MPTCADNRSHNMWFYSPAPTNYYRHIVSLVETIFLVLFICPSCIAHAGLTFPPSTFDRQLLCGRSDWGSFCEV